jgi:hypothetical protein
MLIRQFKCAEMKFLGHVCCHDRICDWDRRCFDECENRIRELLPDSQIVRRNREPPEPEHVTSRLGYVSHLLPGNFVDQPY